MADTLDTKAADQFQTVHRSGHGAITYEGREYTRLEWIERTARNGGTLAAGEGAVLCAELDRLRAVADAADGVLSWQEMQHEDGAWAVLDERLAALRDTI
jgi:hypothetical protein